MICQTECQKKNASALIHHLPHTCLFFPAGIWFFFFFLFYIFKPINYNPLHFFWILIISIFFYITLTHSQLINKRIICFNAPELTSSYIDNNTHINRFKTQSTILDKSKLNIIITQVVCFERKDSFQDSNIRKEIEDPLAAQSKAKSSCG